MSSKKKYFRVNITEQVGTIKVCFPLMVLTSQISGLGSRTNNYVYADWNLNMNRLEYKLYMNRSGGIVCIASDITMPSSVMLCYVLHAKGPSHVPGVFGAEG